MTEPEVRPPPLRCPKCRKADLRLVEVSTVGMAFHQCPDGHVRRINYDGEEHEWAFVKAECFSCRHTWRLRGTTQIPRMLERSDRSEVELVGGFAEPTGCQCDHVD